VYAALSQRPYPSDQFPGIRKLRGKSREDEASFTTERSHSRLILSELRVPLDQLSDRGLELEPNRSRRAELTCIRDLRRAYHNGDAVPRTDTFFGLASRHGAVSNAT
jgi:hypothetical protein